MDYVDSHHKHTQWAYPLKSAISLKGSNGNKCTGKLLLIGWGISHLTALSLSFGRVNHPERAEDESATGDEPSRGAHRGSTDNKKKKKHNDAESKEAIIRP